MEDHNAPAPVSATADADADFDLEAEVRDAILSLDAVRGTRAMINVSVAARHVTLTGVVQSPMAAVGVENAVASVPGVVEVTSYLLDDASLSRQVAEALAYDPRSRDIPPGYRVSSTFGSLTLVGYFNNDQARALMAVTQAVPGVREVNVKAL